jgi:hypothetical protein
MNKQIYLVTREFNQLESNYIFSAHYKFIEFQLFIN